jgi:hypothetical protein
LSQIIQTACHAIEQQGYLDEWGCTVLDGGCLLVALALKKVFETGDLLVD